MTLPKERLLSSLRETELTGKRVLLREDFNVTVDDRGGIMDDFRLRAAIPTIQLLAKAGAKTILLAHLGRPTFGSELGDRSSEIQSDSEPRAPNPDQYRELRLVRVARRLEELLGHKIRYAGDEGIVEVVGSNVDKLAHSLHNGGVALLENVRFDEREEHDRENSLAQALATLGDFFVFDGFGVAHRSAASVDGVAKKLPTYAGLLLEQEVTALTRIVVQHERPFVFIIGGAKIADKIETIEYLLPHVDQVLVGGAIANTLLHAQGKEIGDSLINDEEIPLAQRLIDVAYDKVVLPSDVRLETGQAVACALDAIPAKSYILDIGPETIRQFRETILKAKTILWSGPMGYFEDPRFAEGSMAVAHAIAESSGFSIAGGGETVTVINQAGVFDKIEHVSTGGSAMLEFLAGKKLPGLAFLEN